MLIANGLVGLAGDLPSRICCCAMNDAMAVAAPGSHLISRPKGERRFLPSGGNRKPRASVSSAKSETAPSRMKENGEHPRGGRAEAAREAVAKSIGMKVETLKKFLQRH